VARGRETAQRVFAFEYNSSRHEDRGTEDNAPNFVVTPLGLSVNRLFFIGVLMNKNNTGTAESPNFKAEVRDPTGTFFVYAGQFQPQPLLALSSMEPPLLVGVVGKVRTFTKDDGTFYSSVKPETIFPVDIPQRDRWILETPGFTFDRIKALRDASSQDEPAIEPLLEAGHPRRAAEAAMEARRLYGDVSLQNYINAVRGALYTVLEGEGKPVGLPDQPLQEPLKDDDGGSNEVREQILSFIKDLSGDRGALYRDIMNKCEKAGIDKITLEETIQALLDEGLVYEPTIGLIKPI